MFKNLMTKKYIFIMAVLILLAAAIAGNSFGWGKDSAAEAEAPVKASVEEAEPVEVIEYETAAGLYIRAGASADDETVATIPAGETVSYVSESGPWFEVEYGSNTGFVSSAYLREPGAAKATAPAEGYDVPILMYHAIDEFNGNGIQELYVTPSNFKAQMEYLKSEGFTPVSFDDLPNIESIDKPILITLDDGYKNNINAYNILKEMNDESFQPKATIFMIGKKIDAKTGLSKEKLKEMSDSGIISIQSHTETHPDMTTVTDFDLELKSNKAELEEITGKEVTAFAYPSGKYNAKVIEETQKHYDYAVTTISGIANTNSSNYEMKRVRINYSTSLEEFKKMVQQ